MGWFFGIMESIFPFLFLFILGMFFVMLFRNIGQWHKNNQSPRLCVPASVVTKRTAHHRMNDHSSTSYYVTFEVESGDRMELSLAGQEYGMLAEGDRGKLSFQGTRYLGFERTQG